MKKKKKFINKSGFTPGTVFLGGTVDHNKVFALDLGDSGLNHVFKIYGTAGIDLVMDVEDYYLILFCKKESELVVTKIRKYKGREYYYCTYKPDFTKYDVKPYIEPVTYELTLKVDVGDSGNGPYSTTDTISGVSFREGNWYVGTDTLDYVVQRKYNTRVYFTVMDFEKEESEDYTVEAIAR